MLRSAFRISIISLGLCLSIVAYNFSVDNEASLIFAQDSDMVFKPGDTPYNKSFDEWSRLWWLWHLSIPDIKENESLSHPRDNYSPIKCTWNQNEGPVWFLPDGTDRDDITEPEIRNCTIPADKAFLVQIVGSGCSTVEGFTTEQELLDCAVWVLPQSEFSVSIDGIEVANTNTDPTDRDEFYVEPFETNLSYVENNLYGFEPGTYEGMVAGYYLFSPPLSPGNHEVLIKESAIEFLGGFPSASRQTHTLYNLTIIES